MDLITSYKILGIEPKADENSIKRAYKAQVRRWHPDQFAEGSGLKAEAEEQLKQINIAYARIKSHLTLHGPPPKAKKAPDAPPRSPESDEHHEASSREPPQRTWVDHLFNTLNAFAGARSGDRPGAFDNQADGKPKRTFEQVLNEMTGGINVSPKKRDHAKGRTHRLNYAELYRKYRRQGSSVGEVDPMENKGPVTPVSRVRGIGRRR